jgi:hypothetical protein
MKVVMKPSCACVHDVRYPHHQQTPKEILEKFSFRPGESGAAKRGREKRYDIESGGPGSCCNRKLN